MKAVLPLRGRANRPLLNGKVASWEFWGELCWRGGGGPRANLARLTNVEDKPRNVLPVVTVGGGGGGVKTQTQCLSDNLILTSLVLTCQAMSP